MICAVHGKNVSTMYKHTNNPTTGAGLVLFAEIMIDVPVPAFFWV